MKYRYDYRTGMQKIKFKRQKALPTVFIAAIAMLFGLVFAIAPANAAVSNDYSLFDSATYVSDGGSRAVQTDSLGAPSYTYGGIDYSVPASMTFSQLTNLATSYKITKGDCGGGSPRFQVNIGGHNVFVYIGPAPSYVGCSVGTWVSTGNLTTLGDKRIDTSQYPGGNFYSTYAEAEALLGTQVVTGVQLVVDAGWAVTGNEQTILFDNTQINDLTYNYEPVPSFETCKKDGWKQFTNPSFKNQGDCVSFVATKGKNLPAGVAF